MLPLSSRFRLCTLLVFLLGVCLGCGSAGAQQGNYLLGPGDVVRITVYEHPDLSTEAALSEAGRLRVPLLGEVDAGGLSAAALETMIAARLRAAALITNASVNILVTQFHSQQVAVLGQVARPGKYPLQTKSNVTDLIAMAGGITATGADSAVVIRRDASRVTVDFTDVDAPNAFGANLQVANGDTIFIRRAPVFYIYGEVQRPGAYRLERNMTVMQALSTGGGLTAKGTQRGLTVMRPASGAAGAIEKIRLNLGDPLQADDTLYVQESLF